MLSRKKLCVLLHSQTTYSPPNGGGGPTQSNSVTPFGYPEIQFNSDTGQTQRRSHRFRARSHKTAFLCLRLQSQVVFTSASDWLALNQDSHDSFFGFDNLLDWLTELRETFAYVNGLLKRIQEDTNEQPDEEIYRVRSRRAPSLRVSVPRGWMCHPPSVWRCSLSWKLSQSCTFGIFMKASSCRHCPLLEDGGHGVAFLVMSQSHPGAHHGVPLQNKRDSYHPGNSQEFRSFVPAKRGRDQYIFFLFTDVYPSLYYSSNLFLFLISFLKNLNNTCHVFFLKVSILRSMSVQIYPLILLSCDRGFHCTHILYSSNGFPVEGPLKYYHFLIFQQNYH